MEYSLILDSSIQNADLLYACGFSASDPFLYFSTDKEKGIVVSELEYDRAVTESKNDIKVILAKELIDKKIKTTPINVITALNKKYHSPTWNVPYNFSYGLSQLLTKKGINLKVTEKENATIFFPERKIKSAEEISACRNGLKIAERAMQIVYDTLSKSKIENSGKLIFNGEILTSEYMKTLLGIEILKSGGSSDHTIVSCGIDAAQPHNTGNGPLFANETIVVDIFPRILEPINKELPSGYWGDITRTFVKGKATSEMTKMYNAVKEARNYCQDMIKPGMTVTEPFHKAMEILKQHGFNTGTDSKGRQYGFFHGLGHGVGLEIHELPTLSPRGNGKLEIGEIITVEPGLYYPDIGGIRLENMGVITEDGFEAFNTFSNILEIQ